MDAVGDLCHPCPPALAHPVHFRSKDHHDRHEHQLGCHPLGPDRSPCRTRLHPLFLHIGLYGPHIPGTKPAPDFTGWTDLFIDGLKLAVVWFLWFLPIILVLVVGIVIAITTFLSTQATSVAPNWILLVSVLVLLLIVECILLIIVILFGILGAIRFARTGSIRKGIHFSAILMTIRTIGWLSYIILLIGFVIAMVIYGIITGILSVIPYIGWVLVLIVNPLFTVFTARYFTLVYDHGVPQPARQEQPVEPESAVKSLFFSPLPSTRPPNCGTSAPQLPPPAKISP
jgi:hypothetical protein